MSLCEVFVDEAESDQVGAPGGEEAPTPQSVTFGDEIAWGQEPVITYLYVELPFWLMVDPTSLMIQHGAAEVLVWICSPRMEVFANEVTDSRVTVIHEGPQSRESWVPSLGLQQAIAQGGLVVLPRPCKTVLRIDCQALSGPFPLAEDNERPTQAARDAYWASLCEAYIPVVNEVIQRYRLLTYDYFAYEVSPWDVPVWYVRQGVQHRVAILVPARGWDRRPVEIWPSVEPGGKPLVKQFQFTDGAALAHASSNDATPGEWELLDARSLLERGDYTGAVRRTATAVEAVVESALEVELAKKYDATEVAQRMKKSELDAPGRLAQLHKLLGRDVLDPTLVADVKIIRDIRHDIVHRGRRLDHEDRFQAQWCVDRGRWLFNQVERKPDRARLRDFGLMKSVGRTMRAARFPTRVTEAGIVVEAYPK